MSQSIQSTQREEELSPAAIAEELRARARALARPLASARIAESITNLLIFTAGSERYGLQAEEVEEVIPVREITRVPHTPATIAGVVNHRGRILCIVDLQSLFGAPRLDLPEECPVVVIEASTGAFGLLADEVIGIVPVPRDAVQTSSAGDDRGGVARSVVGDDAIVVLDPEALAGDPRIRVDVAL